MIGFQPLGVDQTLLAGDPPTQLTLFRGGLDPDRLKVARTTSEYADEMSASGVAYWTIGPDGEFDVSNPVQRKMFAAFNNLAILGEDILVCAPTAALLERAIATWESGEGSAALDPVLGLPLHTVPDTTVSAIAATPGMFEPLSAQTPETQELIDESNAAVGAMPPIEGMIVGVEAGAVAAEFYEGQRATPDPEVGGGIALVRLVTTSASDAGQAMAVAGHRWNSMNSIRTTQPYTELMEIVSTEVKGAVAALDFRQLRSPNVWLNMVFGQDLLPFLVDGTE